MKQILLGVTIALSIFVLSCNSKNINGVYVCDKSNKKADTTIHHETSDEGTLDLTCVVIQFDFKGKSTVGIKLANGEIFSSYIIDEGYILIKGDKSDFLLKIQDQNTLVGEGITKGIYHKK